MHSKKNNNSKSRNFIQGLRPFSSTVPRGLKKKLRKGGYNFSNIVDNWTKVVGKNIATTCYPNTVKMGKDMREGTVILNVVHGNEVNIEYSKKEIMDKINSFFGYKCIDQIKLKIIHEKKINNGNLVSAKPKNNIFKTKLDDIPSSVFLNLTSS